MTQYRLVFDGTDVARIKRADDPGDAPLAWFRVVYADKTNDVVAVHVYGHAEAVSGRPWLASCPTIGAALTYCDHVQPGRREGVFDWTGGSIETSST